MIKNNLLLARLVILTAVFGLLPSLAGADSTDVTLYTDTIITVGGVNLIVAGSNASIQSITVNGDSTFSVVLPSGSSIKVTSADRRSFSSDASGTLYSETQVCGSTSDLTLASGGPTGTVTVAVGATACDATDTTAPANTTTAGSNGSPVGGGGSASYIPIINPNMQVAQTIGAVNPSSGSNNSSSIITVEFFAKVLSGSRVDGVKTLQKILNSDSDTQVNLSGAGSPGNETTYFGPATKKAIQKFQVKYGIVKSGQSGYGVFGPKTKAKIVEIAKNKGF